MRWVRGFKISETCRTDHAYILRTYCPQLSAVSTNVADGDVPVRLVGTAFLLRLCIKVRVTVCSCMMNATY